MPKNKIYIVIIIMLVALLLSFFIFEIYKKSLLKNDDNQIDILCEIIKEITNEDENIYLNKSALTNFITKKEYEDIRKLLELQNKNEEGRNFNISISYNAKENILTITKEDSENLYSFTQRYKINIKLKNLEYEIYGEPIETQNFN